MGAVLLEGPKHQALQSFKGKDALSRWENLSQRGRKQSTTLFLFSLRLSSHSSIFHSYGDVTITGEGIQFLTYARHSWHLSSEGSLAFHIYCDMGHSFVMTISENPWHSHLLPSIYSSGPVTTYFYDLGLSRLRFKHPTFRLRGKRSNPLHHRHGLKYN